MWSSTQKGSDAVIDSEGLGCYSRLRRDWRQSWFDSEGLGVVVDSEGLVYGARPGLELVPAQVLLLLVTLQGPALQLTQQVPRPLIHQPRGPKLTTHVGNVGYVDKVARDGERVSQVVDPVRAAGRNKEDLT